MDKSRPEHLPQGAEGRMRPATFLSHIVNEELIQSCVLDQPTQASAGCQQPSSHGGLGRRAQALHSKETKAQRHQATCLDATS